MEEKNAETELRHNPTNSPSVAPAKLLNQTLGPQGFEPWTRDYELALARAENRTQVAENENESYLAARTEGYTSVVENVGLRRHPPRQCAQKRHSEPLEPSVRRYRNVRSRRRALPPLAAELPPHRSPG